MTPVVTAADVVAEALTWEGTPYHHQGRAKGVGVDCVGLPIGVARALGLVAPAFDVPPYPRQPDGTTLLALCDAHMGGRVGRGAVEPGHVLVMRFPGQAVPQHLGIVVPHAHGLALLHAYGTVDGKGRVIRERLNAQSWARVVAAFCLPGVA